MKCLSPVALLLAAAAPAIAEWANVHIGGGGGFPPGIVFHPKTEGLAYARTDIGGLYRRNDDDSWTPITDSITFDDSWHNWGIDAVAVDPNDDQKVLAAVGMYTNSWDPSNGAIIRSSDRGNTWEFFNLDFKVGGNMPGRGMGERLVVDPVNSDIVYFGARSGNGLFKSTDGGATFKKVDSYEAVGTFIADPSDTNGYNSDIQGLAWVTFDPTSKTVGGVTSRIFVGTADNITASVYVSEDAGKSWNAVEGQPGTFFPHKGRISPEEGALYITYSDGTGPYDGTLGSVWRYDIVKGTWTEITPVSGSDLYFGFGGLGLDAKNPGTLVVAALNSWWPEAQLFRSTDSGATWKALWQWTSYPNKEYAAEISAPKAPWIEKSFLDVPDAEKFGWMIESFEIDPFNSDHFLYGTGLTIYGGYDLTNWDSDKAFHVESLADGVEEMAVLGLASVPGGTELLAAVGDDCGFTFKSSSDLDTPPKTTWMTPKWASSSGVDYAGTSAKAVVRVGNSQGDHNVANSNGGGTDWYINYGSDETTYGGTVAYSADAETILWSSSNKGVLRSQHQDSFAAVDGLPSGAVIAADRREGGVFYGGSGASFYVSKDSGSTFSKGGKLSGASEVRGIATHPTKAGEVYVSTDVGVFHSTDSGSAFTQVGSLTDTQKIAVGLGSGDSWNVYVFGTGDAGARLYGSADAGKTWSDIQGDKQGFGALSANVVAGSGNVANQVYVGTNGRGVFYDQVSISGGGNTGSGSNPGNDSGAETSSTTSSARPTTTAKATTTTLATSTKTTPTTTKTTPTSTSGGSIGHYGQCGGGEGYNGPTDCAAPYTCKRQNDYYAQCL